LSGLSGKVAIVTGAAQGIGEAIALALAREKATVVVCDLDASGSSGVAQQIVSAGAQSLAVPVDVTSSEAVARLVSVVMRRYGRIDCLVNNAGIHSDRKLVDMSEAEWRRMLDVNLTSMFLCCRADAPVMIERGSGRIVNMSSQSAVDGCSEACHYGAAKAGVIGFTRSLARELGAYGITVNAVAPGIIQTPMNPPERIRLKQEGWLKRLALKRFGMPEDVANAVVFLLSDQAGYVTGDTLFVNGGMRMGG
jgi:3-oxoacyl-[acyl-carrier protein] reductase